LFFTPLCYELSYFDLIHEEHLLSTANIEE